jgi:hypothetical protein
MMQRHLGLAALLVLATGVASATGCTRTVKTVVRDDGRVKVYLRHTVESFTEIDRAYQHPTTIAAQRLAHILGAIEVEVQGGKKRQMQAALHPKLLRPIANGLAEAFETANSGQQVAVMAIRKQQRLGVFHKKYLTSLIAFFRDDRLYIQFSRIEWEIPRNREDAKLPEPQPNEKQMPFRTIPAIKMKPLGAQGVVVRWRDNVFSAPVRRASSVGGDFNKRTLLLESPLPEAEADEGIDAVNLEADTLRAIADLKEARRSGEITEAEYREHLEEILGENSY